MDADISRRRAGAFDVYEKNDGRDYWRIAEAYLGLDIDRAALMAKWPWHTTVTTVVDGEAMELTTLSYTNPKRLVWKVEMGGRRYVLKWANMGTYGLKRLFPRRVGLTYFTRIMRLVSRAAARGCRVTQDYCLVAEKWIGPFRQEVLVLLEYIDGKPLGDIPEREALNPQLREAVEELVRHDLTLDDFSPYNFLATPDGIRAIDLSCRPPTALYAAKMIVRMNRRYGLDVPVAGFFGWLARALM